MRYTQLSPCMHALCEVCVCVFVCVWVGVGVSVHVCWIYAGIYPSVHLYAACVGAGESLCVCKDHGLTFIS